MLLATGNSAFIACACALVVVHLVINSNPRPVPLVLFFWSSDRRYDLIDCHAGARAWWLLPACGLLSGKVYVAPARHGGGVSGNVNSTIARLLGIARHLGVSALIKAALSLTTMWPCPARMQNHGHGLLTAACAASTVIILYLFHLFFFL